MKKQKIKYGILGGSFNPPHQGHLNLALAALNELHLNYVIILPAKQNPFKKTAELLPFAERLNLCANLFKNPKFIISDFETKVRSCKSYNVIFEMKKSYKNSDFIWLTGADNFCEFHKWHRWKDLIELVSIAVMSRDGKSKEALKSPAALYMLQNQKNLYMLNEPEIKISSTELRN